MAALGDRHVIKQCIDAPHELAEKCGGIWPQRDTSTPFGIARYLKTNQNFYHDLFSEALPELVVRSQFVIGTSSSQNAKGAVYEIQPKCEIALNLSQYFLPLVFVNASPEEIPIVITNLSCALIQKIEKTFSDSRSRTRFLQQIPKLRERFEYMMNHHNRALDIFGSGNLIVTPEGDIRLIDVDAYAPAHQEDGSATRQKQIMEQALQILEKVLQNFSSVL